MNDRNIRPYGLESSFNERMRSMFVESGSFPIRKDWIIRSHYRRILVRTEYAEENLRKNQVLILTNEVGVDESDPKPDAIATISFYLKNRIGYAEIRVVSNKIEEDIYLRNRAFGIIGKINERPEA